MKGVTFTINFLKSSITLNKEFSLKIKLLVALYCIHNKNCFSGSVSEFYVKFFLVLSDLLTKAELKAKK